MFCLIAKLDRSITFEGTVLVDVATWVKQPPNLNPCVSILKTSPLDTLKSEGIVSILVLELKIPT